MFIYVKSEILHFWNKFSTIQNFIIVIIHSISPDLDPVSGTGLHSHHTAACGAHHASLAVGAVACLPQPDTIDVEEAVVSIPALHLGIHAEAHSPCSRHRHSEDP